MMCEKGSECAFAAAALRHFQYASKVSQKCRAARDESPALLDRTVVPLTRVYVCIFS